MSVSFLLLLAPGPGVLAQGFSQTALEPGLLQASERFAEFCEMPCSMPPQQRGEVLGHSRLVGYEIFQPHIHVMEFAQGACDTAEAEG